MSPILQRRKQRSERLENLPEVTQQVDRSAEIKVIIVIATLYEELLSPRLCGEHLIYIKPH